MAEAARGKEPARGSAPPLNQAVAASGQMDMSGFRIGKQRLVSKKKGTSQLKKVILEEREYHHSRGLGQAARGGGARGVGGQPGASATGLSLDAPEFVPSGWGLGGAALQASPLVAVGKGAVAGSTVSVEAIAPRSTVSVEAAAPGSTVSVEVADVALGAAPGSNPGAAVAPATPNIFLPPWCQGASAAIAAGSAAAEIASEPAAAAAVVRDDGGEGDAAAAAAAAPSDGACAVALLGDEAGQTSDSAPELPVAAAIERLSAAQEAKKRPQERKQKQVPAGTNIEVRHYVHQVLSDDLDEKVKYMLGELARYQERAKERDPLKFQKQKRYCVGMRESQRAVSRSKAKCIICAPNLEECGAEGGLDDTVEDLIEACRETDVPVIFALSRNRIGKALGKNIRLSIVCILSVEGAHQELKQILKQTDDLRRQWVLRQMANLSTGDAEAARLRAEERARRNEERRILKAQQDAERKAEEERKRAEAKAVKEAEKARRQAVHQAEMERRRALKAQKEEAARMAADVDAEVAKQEALVRAEEERKRRAEEAEMRRREAAKHAMEEKRRAEEAAAAQAEKAKLKAAAVAVGEEAEESDADSDSSSGSSVPLGFNAALF